MNLYTVKFTSYGFSRTIRVHGKTEKEALLKAGQLSIASGVKDMQIIETARSVIT